ncbi:MAG: iron dicitrate transport regulator FecR, partial [Candidatus Nephrothrix sp. EaCA]
MNTNHRHDMKALVFSFFENRATPLQKMEADKWLQKEENQRTYLQWLEEWENQNREYHPDTEKHLAKFVAFMHEHADRPRSAERGLRTRGNAAFHYWKPAAAAALIIFMGIGGWTFKDYFLFRRYKTSYGEMKTLVLEDGSIVTLNGNSSLKVSRWNFKSHRNVYLKGEANFSVSHSNEGAPFVVKTDNQFDVKVT